MHGILRLFPLGDQIILTKILGVEFVDGKIIQPNHSGGEEFDIDDDHGLDRLLTRFGDLPNSVRHNGYSPADYGELMKGIRELGYRKQEDGQYFNSRGGKVPESKVMSLLEVYLNCSRELAFARQHYGENANPINAAEHLDKAKTYAKRIKRDISYDLEPLYNGIAAAYLKYAERTLEGEHVDGVFEALQGAEKYATLLGQDITEKTLHFYSAARPIIEARLQYYRKGLKEFPDAYEPIIKKLNLQLRTIDRKTEKMK